MHGKAEILDHRGQTQQWTWVGKLEELLSVHGGGGFALPVLDQTSARTSEACAPTRPSPVGNVISRSPTSPRAKLSLSSRFMRVNRSLRFFHPSGTFG
jgi:hypothetical protein